MWYNNINNKFKGDFMAERKQIPIFESCYKITEYLKKNTDKIIGILFIILIIFSNFILITFSFSFCGDYTSERVQKTVQ